MSTVPPGYFPPAANTDNDQLRALSIAHYVVGGLIALCGMIPLIYVAMGLAMVNGLFENPGGPGRGQGPPPEMGWFLVVFGGIAICLSLLLAACVVFAGRSLVARKRYVYCMVMAIITCVMWMPIGTVLGVLTIIVLVRPSVKQQFDAVAYGNSYAANR